MPRDQFDRMVFEKYGLTMTIEQAAQALSISKDTLRRILQRGEIRGRQAKRKWIFSTHEVLEYLYRDKNEVKPVEQRKKTKLIS